VLFRSHKIDLRFSTPPEPIVCRLDATLMKQAILNLLINAQQAMPDGGSIYIKIDLHGDDLARLDVIDTGPGIPENQQERIFQAYYSTKKGGTGLGLAMTRKIIREHDGRILVYSSPPSGSCFTILLPRLAQPPT
jgi:two-component system, NtrC family, sensor histidine kinase HydH